MYNKKLAPTKTTIQVGKMTVGETIEKKIRRIVNNKEPITDGAPLIYTERAKGVEAQYNIRTDRWEIGLDAMDYVTRSHIAKREAKPNLGEQAKEGMAKEQPKTPPITGEQQS